MTESIAAPGEFSRPVAVARITREPSTWEIEAKPAECDALARRFDIPGLHHLSATILLQFQPGGDIHLQAVLRAQVSYLCSVTLEPFSATIETPFGVIFRPGLDEEEADRLALEDPGEDVIEPLDGETIDIGEIVAQELSLALDPYPRSPGLDTVVDAPADSVEETPAGPFAALARLRPQ